MISLHFLNYLINRLLRIIVLITFILFYHTYFLYSQVWQKADNIGNLRIITLYVDENNTYYTGTEDSGAYRSYDFGRTWTQINTGILEDYISGVNCFSSYDDRLYTAVGNALGGHLYVSTDDGSNWLPTNFPLGLFEFIAYDSVICASTGSFFALLFRSTDFGESWIFTQNPWDAYLYYYSRSNDTLYALSAFEGVKMSTDLGESWNCIGFAEKGNYSLLLHNDMIIVSNELGVFTSDDMGITWLSFNSNLSNDSMRILSLTTGDNLLFAASDTCIYYSHIQFDDNLTPWQRIDKTGLEFVSNRYAISVIKAAGEYLLLGTLDYDSIGMISANKGMGIWYYPINNLPVTVCNDFNNDFNIYPNPSYSTLYIEINSSEFTVRLYNLSGQLMYTADNKNVLDISQIETGVYIVSLSDGNRILNRKIVKL